ncbi:bacillithiol biosynthesis cysteine-adding enzyme BshC [Virgibacillus ainsalahensis]
MQSHPLKLRNKNDLINDYRLNKEKIHRFFDYNPRGNYKQRVSDLNTRHFDREGLANILHTINEQWDAPESTVCNLERLKEENSVVVIGGQQAGIMTGPLYSINKIISIIQFAKQQETELNIPVIPVFWIAGEDHDFDEINHLFLPEESKIKKHKIPQRVLEKRSVSQIEVDKSISSDWIKRLFEHLTETQYTKDLYETINNCLDKSTTYVDFFARLVFQLFKDEGLILIDSGDQKIRHFESSHFVQLIEQQPEISKGVYEAYIQLQQAGYSVSLDLEADDAHLFYHKDNERILLFRNEAGDWIGKQNEIRFTTDELIAVAKNQPELLSNNVVTRPLMQEMLFPTLAFIGGAGEVSYWSVLKPAFRTLQMNVPPVLPRLSFTFVERKVDKALRKFEIDIDHAVNQGVEQQKQSWLASKSDPPIEQTANDIKRKIDSVHKPLREIAKGVRSDLGDLSEKNLKHLYYDIEFLQDSIMKAIEEKYKLELSEFDLINNALHPQGNLQERVWNPLPLINEYGIGFIKNILEEPYLFENEHYVVYI